MRKDWKFSSYNSADLSQLFWSGTWIWKFCSNSWSDLCQKHHKSGILPLLLPVLHTAIRCLDVESKSYLKKKKKIVITDCMWISEVNVCFEWPTQIQAQCFNYCSPSIHYSFETIEHNLEDDLTVLNFLPVITLLYWVINESSPA